MNLRPIVLIDNYFTANFAKNEEKYATLHILLLNEANVNKYLSWVSKAQKKKKKRVL